MQGVSKKTNAVAEEIINNGGTATVVSASLCDTEQTKELCKFASMVDVLVLNASVQYKNKWGSM